MVITVNGTKCYPVARWEDNQHKVEYFRVKALNRRDESGWTDEEAIREVEELDEILTVFDAGVRPDGIVYVPWKYFQRIKEVIVRYDLCH